MPLDNINRDNRVTLRYWKNYKTTVNGNEKAVGHVALEVYGEYSFYASFWPERPASLFDWRGVPGKWRRSYLEDKLAEARSADSARRPLPERAEISIDLYALDTKAMYEAYCKLSQPGLLRYAAPGSTMLAIPGTANCCTVVDSLLKVGGIDKLYVSSGWYNYMWNNRGFIFQDLTIACTGALTSLSSQIFYNQIFQNTNLLRAHLRSPSLSEITFYITAILIATYRGSILGALDFLTTNSLALFFQYIQLPNILMESLGKNFASTNIQEYVPTAVLKSIVAKLQWFILKFNLEYAMQAAFTTYDQFRNTDLRVFMAALPMDQRNEFAGIDKQILESQNSDSSNSLFLKYSLINYTLMSIARHSLKLLYIKSIRVVKDVCMLPKDVLEKVEIAKSKEKLYYQSIDPDPNSNSDYQSIFQPNNLANSTDGQVLGIIPIESEETNNTQSRVTNLLDIIRESHRGIFCFNRSSGSIKKGTISSLIRNNTRVAGGLFLFQTSSIYDREPVNVARMSAAEYGSTQNNY